MISAGRVLLMPRGDYDNTATYEMLDIVSYNGSSYIAKGTTTGNLPTNTTYWQLSAYGGSAANMAGNFAPLETTEYASRAYSVGEIFVDKDSQLVKATATINIGDQIVSGTNCDNTTIAELLESLTNYVDALDQRNRKLVGVNVLTIQTDLHVLALGEYYKKATNFYVTNAPTGIASVPAAKFRLSVESGLDENDNSKLLTLRTLDGEVWTQAFDGTTWSDWTIAPDVSDVTPLAPAIGATQGMIAPVEADAASSAHAYAIGEQLIVGGVLYTATTVITVGDALVVGTNLIASDEIVKQLANHSTTTDAVPTEGSVNPVQSGGVFNADKDIVSNIAPYEADLTNASRAYAQGDCFIYDNKLYSATAAILQGGTITIGTNADLATKTISEQIINVANTVANKADSTALTTLDGKAYKTDSPTAQSIDDNDLIPFYDVTNNVRKHIPASEIRSQGGAGAGSLFVIHTDEAALDGKTVSITDGVLVWQGTFASGVAEVVGVTSIGQLQITSTDGVDTAETLYTVKNYSRYDVKLNFYTVYGFKVDSTKATGNVDYHVKYDGTNVENYDFEPGYMNFSTDTWIWGSWTGEEFFMPRPVLIKQDYSEKIYLNPDNLALDEDGNDVSSMLTGATDGYNAMMEWGRNGKKIWYKLVPESDDATYTCYIADKQLDNDFHAWSFYDANNVLGDHFYTAIYKGSTVGSALRSLSGKTPNNTEAGATQITRAKANNKNGETYAWYIDVYADRVLINLLMMLVIKSTNSDVIGYGNYTGGSSASNLMQTGQGNTKGMFYGKQSNSVVKVFGMEQWFADSWRRLAGLILNGGSLLYKLTYGTADGSSAAGYIESDSAPSNYLASGKTIATNLSSSYIMKHSALSKGALLATTFGGSNGNYYSDACWSSTGVKYARVGGNCVDGSACGAFALYLTDALSVSSWAYGAALSLKPLAE